MASSFRSRVFRLLLLFAAVPSIALTIIGYYLAVDQAPFISPETSGDSNELRDYFYEMLYRDIGGVMNDYLDSNRAIEDRLDFAVSFDSQAVAGISLTGDLPDETINRLREAIAERPQGLVAVGNRFFQYVTRPTPDSHVLVGGIIHDSTLATTLESARRGTVATSARRELHATYVLFLGLLFLMITSLTIVAAYVFSSRVSRNLAQPVMALSDASRQIAAGDFKQEVKVTAEGEIGFLINNFNRMAAQLDQATSRLAQTERVAAWRQVARRFAHELKNPLQPILVSLYRIEQRLAATDAWDEVKDPLRAASEEVKHLTLLAERFSSLAKLPPPTIAPVDLKGLVSTTVELYLEKLDPFDFEIELPPDAVTVESDAAFLREALHNLLQNAIDASQPGDRITVCLAAGETSIQISVSDTGAGMDASTLSSSRLPYFSTKAKGSGLGLAIVEKSMAELGGQLSVESEKDRGTTVTLVMPGESA